MADVIEVTAAIIQRKGRVLICRRPAEKRCGLLWEFPGGKVESGETGEECIRRECWEELGVELEAPRLFTDVTHSYPGYTVHIRFYTAELAAGEPKRREHAALCWAAPEELSKYEFCPADAEMLAANRLTDVFYEGR